MAKSNVVSSSDRSALIGAIAMRLTELSDDALAGVLEALSEPRLSQADPPLRVSWGSNDDPGPSSMEDEATKGRAAHPKDLVSHHATSLA